MATLVALAAACGLAVLTPSRSAAIVFGQFNDFQDGTTMEWEHGLPSPNPPTNAAGGAGGPNDLYLRNVSSGQGGAGSLQTVFNDTVATPQNPSDPNAWAGDYVAAGVTRIEARMANLGATDLSMRVALQSNAAPRIRYVSTNAIALAPGGGWVNVAFDLTSTALTNVSGFGDLATVLADVQQLRFVSNPNPSFTGESIAATLGVDNVRALRLPGDANFDRVVNTADFGILAANFTRTGRTWNQGDFNFDGVVNTPDFAILAANFTKSIPSPAGASESGAAPVTDADRAALAAFATQIESGTVPEPSALGLLGLGLLLRRRRARS